MGRSAGERDEVTVELVFAVASGLFLAGVTGLAVLGAVWVLDLSGPVSHGVWVAAFVVAAVVLVWRVVAVLWRFDGRRGKVR